MPSPPYPYKNRELKQEERMVFETGVQHSPRSQNLNKPLSFYSSTCLTSLAFVVAGSQTCIWLHQQMSQLKLNEQIHRKT